jgi:hypothetical protein
MAARHDPQPFRNPWTQEWRFTMPLLIGVLLALAVGAFGSWMGMDRDRSFYPVIMIVIAGLYSLFALIGHSTHALVMDALIGSVFILAASFGFKRSLWIVVAALAGHGLMDLFHGALVANPGVPAFWPAFCMAYDVVAAAYLAGLILGGRMRAGV